MAVKLDSMPSDLPKLSIIMPAFNEATRIGSSLEAICGCLGVAGEDVELIVVDDGSRDETADIVRAFAAEPLTLRLLANSKNRGKGHAVRAGVLASRGDQILVCDADLSTPIEELAKLRHWLDRGYDIVIGSRDMPDSRLDPPQPPLRRWAAWIFRAIRRRLLLSELRDTQCGFKLFRGEVAREVFAAAQEDGWLYDCETLLLAVRRGYRIKEVGVAWRNRSPSRVHLLRDAAPTLLGLLRLRRRK